MVFNYFTISSLINALTSFIFCFFVLTRNPRSQLNRSFAFFASSVGFWAINHFFGFSIQDQSAALFFHRALMAGAIFIPSTFFHFVCVLLGIYDKKKKVILCAYIASIIFFASDFTPLFIPSVTKKLFFNYFENFGPMYHPFLIMFAGLTLYSHYLMYEEFKSTTGARKNQIKYVFVGTLIGFIGGSTSFFLVYNIPIPPIGNCLVTVYILMVAIAISRHQLMDISIFALRTFLFIIVYLIVLGIPIVLATMGKSWLSRLGNNWHLYLLLFGMALASAGPFIFLYLQRRTENALLRRQRSYQNVLLSLAKRMTRLRSMAELFEAIGKTIVDAVNASYVGIYLMDEEHNAYRIQFSHPKKDKSRFDEFLPLDHPIIKILSERKKPLLTHDVPLFTDRQGLYFSLIVPSFMEDDLLAFIVLGSKPKRDMYTEDDIVVFETLSYSMALSIENCFFWENVEDHQRQERLEELDAFSYSVAHEIQNPMNAVSGNADLLMKLLKKLNLSEDKFRDVTLYLNDIIEGSDRVLKMVEAIHQFGKKTTGEFGPLDIVKVVKIFCDAHAPELKYKGVTLVKEIPDEPIFIRGEQGELMMVFNNFYKNSLHALLAAPGKKITIKVEKITSDRVRVSFSDTGYGIAKDKLHIVFTQFVTTKASTEGSGMGLYVVKSVVNRHKGKIWAESEGKDRGATFFLELPILKDVKSAEAKEDIKSRWGF